MSNSSSSKSQRKQSSSRDKNKSYASESGGSSQCDTPPLTDKDASTSQGKYAGISPESVQCMAEQLAAIMNPDAAANLAEDVSYKIRQIISNVAVQSAMMKKSQVDSWDVNSTLMLSDTSPVVGATTPHFVPFGDDKFCAQVESVLNITETATSPQTFTFSSPPTLSVEWITDDRSLSGSSTISAQLQNYYTKVARAILNLKRKPKEMAVEDLTTNTRIGPIFPNLFNLAVLVLNDDNLKALNVPAKKPLQSNVLDMVDALCSNPCSADTNIQQQFQRLFPVMVSNILGNGSLSEKLVSVLTKITRTWPTFVPIGKEILFDYLSQGSKERLTAAMIKCVSALGREPLVQCLGDHLEYIDDVCRVDQQTLIAVLDASTCLLQSEKTTYLEDFVMTDYTLYEMLGDSIMPRRTLFPYTDPTQKSTSTRDKSPEDDYPYIPMRARHDKIRCLKWRQKDHTTHRGPAFRQNRYSAKNNIVFKVKGVRNVAVRKKQSMFSACALNKPTVRRNNNNNVVLAKGLLNRFRFKLNKRSDFPIFGAYLL